MGSQPSVTTDVSSALEIPSRLAAIDDARIWMTGHLRDAGASDDLVWECELALTEVLSNVIRHAYGGDESRSIALSLRLREQELEVDVLHDGVAFSNEGYREPDLDAAPVGGYGLHLIRELMDEFEQVEGPGSSTRLRLTKRR